MDEARRNLEESVFGMSGNINATAAATVFVGLIGFLVLLELAFNRAEEMAAEVNGKELFEKLKKELTMMGILSFTVFIYQTAYADAENAYYEAFEMSHIIILFVAIAFIIQASFLLNFAVEEGNNFLRTSRTTHAELLEQYVLMLIMLIELCHGYLSLSLYPYVSWLSYREHLSSGTLESQCRSTSIVMYPTISLA